ncbi:MAG: acetyl-CoA carboxylase [Arenicellales bacterium]
MAEEHIVEAHLPGIFYRRPSPEAEPYVNEGDTVGADDTIGLIEVMKSYHEVKAGIAGRVVEFMVENEGEIQPGEPLARVEKS